GLGGPAVGSGMEDGRRFRPRPYPKRMPAERSEAAQPAGQPLNAAGQAADLSLAALIDGPQRSVANKERDRYRHPLEVLTFFGVKADSNVVEIVLGRAGYWTEILAPYLKDRCH